LREYHSEFWAKIKEKKLKNKKEIISGVWNLEEMIIFLFLRPAKIHNKKRIKIIILPEAKSTPEAGLMASWKGR
jgi:hypothetical protein